MNLALTVDGWLDEEIIFAQQLGVKYLFAQVDLRQVASPGWDSRSLAGLANRITKAGLILAGLDASIKPGGRGAQEEQLELTCRLIHAAGMAGFRLVRLPGSFFPATRQASQQLPIRLVRLAETAGQAGVRLALPADRLLASLPGQPAQGSPGIPPGSVENLPGTCLLLDAAPGLLLNLAQANQPAGRSASPGSREQQLWDKIILVSFENSAQRRPAAGTEEHEANEMIQVGWHLKQAGYAGFIRLGQQPQWQGDARGALRARAFTTGFLRGVLQAIQAV